MGGAGAPAPAAAQGPQPVDARVSAAFTMNGIVTAAVRVRGEHRGQHVVRRWSFTGRSCTGDVCRQLVLIRQRSAGRTDRLVLNRTGVGRYAASGRFFAGLRCRGRVYPRGEIVPYRISVAVTQAAAVQGITFATGLAATYTNTRRIDTTICPLGPSHDAARYLGLATPPPAPPTAAFTAAVGPGTSTGTFTDTSAAGTDNAPIVSVLWQFGDPASGPANTATTPQATHAFTAPGTYTVSLTVTDANGLTSTQAQQVTVPAPPPPA